MSTNLESEGREVHEIQQEINRITHKWTPRSSSFREAPYLTLYSKIFYADPIKDPHFFLSLDSQYGEENYYSLFLNVIHNESRGKVKFALLNDEGQEVLTKFIPTVNLEEFRPIGVQNFAPKALIHKLAKSSLTIVCVIDYMTRQFDFSVPKHIILQQRVDRELHRNFQCLLNSEQFADVTLSVDGVEFRAHKAILAARSEVFADLFEHKMAERPTNCVQIADVRSKVFRKMLNFIYSGSIKDQDEIVIDLLIAADKYALKTLKHVCEEKLCDNLSVETSKEILLLAERYNCAHLKAQAQDFINSHATKDQEISGNLPTSI